MVRQRDLLQIVGTLKHGAFFGESRKRIIVVYIIFASVFSLGMIGLVVALFFEKTNNFSSLTTVEFVFTLIVVIAVFSFPPIMFLIIIIKNEKTRKEILLWLVDAVELKAFSKGIGIWNPQIFAPTVKIQVNFEINGLNHAHISCGKPLGSIKHEGYHKIWSKYVDRQIRILYSPKFDQVMVLKD